MDTVQNTQNLAITYPQGAHQQDSIPDNFGKCFQRMVRPLERKFEDSKPTSSGVIIAGQNEAEDKLAKSHMGYLKCKTDSMQDYKKALDPIAQTKWESFKSGAGKVLKTLKDWTIKVVKFVYRYTGLEFIVNAIKSKVTPKIDMHHAKKFARQEGRAGMLEQLKKLQGTPGIAAPVTPRTTVSSLCSGQKGYDLAGVENSQEAEVRDSRAMAAISDIEKKRAAIEAEKIQGYVANRNRVERANAQINTAIEETAQPKYNEGGMAYYFSTEKTPAEMPKAKAVMDAKMAARLENQRGKKTSQDAEKQIRLQRKETESKLKADISRAADTLMHVKVFDLSVADRARGPIKGILKKSGSPASGKTVTFKVVEQPIEELEAAMLNSQHFKRSMDRLVAGRQRRAERLDQNELEEIQAEMVLSPEQLVAYEDARRSAAIAEVQKIVAATEYKKFNGWRPIFRN